MTGFLRTFFAICIAMSAAKVSAITADDFQLVGPDGRVAARLTLSSEGTPALFFFDKLGRNRMNLSLYPEGVGGLVMNDVDGRAVAILRMHGSHERPVLVLKSQGQDRLVLGLRDNDAGEPYVEPVPANITGGSPMESSPILPIILHALIAAVVGFIAGKAAAWSK